MCDKSCMVLSLPAGRNSTHISLVKKLLDASKHHPSKQMKAFTLSMFKTAQESWKVRVSCNNVIPDCKNIPAFMPSKISSGPLSISWRPWFQIKKEQCFFIKLQGHANILGKKCSVMLTKQKKKLRGNFKQLRNILLQLWAIRTSHCIRFNLIKFEPNIAALHGLNMVMECCIFFKQTDVYIARRGVSSLLNAAGLEIG